MRQKIRTFLFLMIPLSIFLLEYDRKSFKMSRNEIKFSIQNVNSTFLDLSILHMIDMVNVLRSECGELCDTSRSGSPGPFFEQIKASTNCQKLFLNTYSDTEHGMPNALRDIPRQLTDDFTMNKRIPVRKWYFDQKYLGNKAQVPLWTTELIEEMISQAKKGNLSGNYLTAETNALRDGLRHSPGVRNGRVLVIGSENPWVEACVLEAGASEVVTLEYGQIISKHPRVKTLIPSEFRIKFLNNSLQEFDAVVTFSSVEHSGLGRYGDSLNPWGDIIAIAKAWCVTKKGGSLTIGVPYDYENEFLRFNADRFYGKIRYPFLTTNWQQFYRGKGSQRVHVFLK